MSGIGCIYVLAQARGNSNALKLQLLQYCT